MAGGLRSITPGFVGKVGAPESTPPPPTGQAGVKSLFPGRLARIGRDPAVSAFPTINSIGTVRNLAQVAIYGENFGASPGAVFLDIVGQTVDEWSDTYILFACRTSYLKYQTLTLKVVTSTGLETNAIVSTVPYIGYDYVDLVEPLALPEYRITATPDLAGGDQLEWGNIVGSGTVDIRPDGSFVADPTVDAFSVRVNDGTGWSPYAVQQVSGAQTITVSGVYDNGQWKAFESIGVNQGGVWKTPLAGFVKTGGAWKRFWPDYDPAPVVRMTRPTDGDTKFFQTSGVFNTEAVAFDDLGIYKVDFYIQKSGDLVPIKYGTVYNPPYSAYVDTSLHANGTGTYELWAVATDNQARQTTESAHITITLEVNQPPVVTLVNAPVYPTPQYGTVRIDVDATDPDGTVSQVSLYRREVEADLNFSLVQVDTTGNPFVFIFSTVGWNNSLYEMKATATDNDSGQTSVTFFMVVDNLPTPSISTRTPYVNASTGEIRYYATASQVSGKLYHIVTTNPSTPTGAQIKAGRDASNNLALGNWNTNVTYAGEYAGQVWQEVLTRGNTYYGFWVQQNAQGAYSNVVGASVFLPQLMTVSATPTSLYGYKLETGSTFSSAVTASTNAVDLTIINGVSPITVTWEKLSGDDATPIALLTNQRYVFSRTVAVVDGGYETRTATYRAVVTDGAGKLAYSPTITVTTDHEYLRDTGGIPP